MKFAHFSDVHIGSWSDPRLSDVSTTAFMKAVDLCFQNRVDFILISGDFFDTSMPPIDNLKDAVSKLKEVRDRNIPVYLVAGSHDFSPTGKTMLSVLESAGLVSNVMKGQVVDNKLKLRFTVDPKTGAKITGIIGKKGMLERKYFENLITENLESEDGFKIFLFHTAVSELKPEGLEKMESTPLSSFPKGFDYYAGGHVHEPLKTFQKSYGVMTYPGPLFPNNFREVEKLGRGGFYFVEAGESLKVAFQPIVVHNVMSFSVDCTNKTPRAVEEAVKLKISGKEFNDTIVTLRLFGTLKSGKPSEIDLSKIFDFLYDRSAHFVMKNTAALKSQEMEEVKITGVPVESVESAVIREHLSKIKLDGMTPEKEYLLTKQLLVSLSSEKSEGETVATFERRVKEDAEKLLNLKL